VASPVQQAGHRSIGEKPAVGLACRAVVALVFCINDTLLPEIRRRDTARRYRAVDSHFGRNAVTFEGKPAPVSSRSRPIHSLNVDLVASCRREISSALSFDVNFIGESRADGGSRPSKRCRCR